MTIANISFTLLAALLPLEAAGEILKSQEHPDVAALALDILTANCPPEKVHEFKTFIGKNGFKFDVRQTNYSSYKTLEVLAKGENSAIFLVKDYDRTGAPN